MGMFDELRVRVPLPVELPVAHREHWFQTKSLGSLLEYYEITEDGYLFAYGDMLDNAGIPLAYTGEIRFYTQPSEIGKKDPHKESGWLECSAYFVAGKLQSMNLIEYRKE